MKLNQVLTVNQFENIDYSLSKHFNLKYLLACRNFTYNYAPCFPTIYQNYALYPWEIFLLQQKNFIIIEVPLFLSQHLNIQTPIQQNIGIQLFSFF